ncbi:MAG: adenosine deaminase, partial [Acidimicrobiia bacterium]|nr:adenosine deaminase [Acidimicrobiia bacterium]
LEPPGSHFTVDLITGPRAPVGVVGLGLGGPEPGFPAHLFTSSFSKARAAGLASLPHAGETEGPESIWDAIRSLGANRIGHGTRSVEDAVLLGYLAENDIDLEVCLSSNQATGVIASIEEHPLQRMMGAGISISVNTDDPAYFGTTLNRELRLARDVHQVGIERLKQVQKDALAASYASPADKARIREELDHYDGPTP